MILTVEIVDRGGSVGLYRDKKIIALEYHNSAQPHSERLFPRIKQLCESNSIKLQEIEQIGVCRGPGAFTAIRLGVTAAKVLAMVCKAHLVGFSSLELLAYYGAGFSGEIHSVIGARRGELYHQQFSWDSTIKESVAITEPRLVKPEVLRKETSKSTPVLLIGRPRQWQPNAADWPNNVEFYPTIISQNLAPPLLALTVKRAVEKQFDETDLMAPCYVRGSDSKKTGENK